MLRTWKIVWADIVTANVAVKAQKEAVDLIVLGSWRLPEVLSQCDASFIKVEQNTPTNRVLRHNCMES